MDSETKKCCLQIGNIIYVNFRRLKELREGGISKLEMDRLDKIFEKLFISKSNEKRTY